ncbi:Nif3-like dinuclear metal center hexameric protein [Alkalilimnicola ehrlichii MLHE-1]|nr:Nif3-like dinuclear metal center hexameric protein [Alkalilimnicola ehrlichii]
MAMLSTLIRQLDAWLQPAALTDYAPNGLQVEGRAEVTHLVTGVTASQRFLERALAAGADALLVHHGYFWKGEPAPIVGMKGRRIATLLRADVSLLAYHLPLDVHPEFGNNVRLGQVLCLPPSRPVTLAGLEGLGRESALAVPERLPDFAVRVARGLEREPLVVAGGDHPVQRVIWCTGGGQDFIHQAAALGADTYISGEISERTTHAARELGVHYLCAGHHATERYGVQALGAALAEHLGVAHTYVEVDNPA